MRQGQAIRKQVQTVLSSYEQVEYNLDNWAQWHKSASQPNLGYPKKSMGIKGGGQSIEGVFEELCDRLDHYTAEVTEAIVNDLTISQRGAIWRRWLGCSIFVRNPEQTLQDAYDVLVRRMAERGLI